MIISTQGSGTSLQGILGSGTGDGEGIWWISNGQFYGGESLGGAFITSHGYRSWNFKKIVLVVLCHKTKTAFWN